jgi:hypothetical protein
MLIADPLKTTPKLPLPIFSTNSKSFAGSSPGLPLMNSPKEGRFSTNGLAGEVGDKLGLWRDTRFALESSRLRSCGREEAGPFVMMPRERDH